MSDSNQSKQFVDKKRQVLQNKAIDSGAAKPSNFITVPAGTTTALSALERREGSLAFDTTQSLLVVDDGSGFAAIDGSSSADNVTYDNGDSGLTATDVQAALDEIVANPVTASGVSGAVQFSGGSGVFSSDDTNLHWDNTSKLLGIGTATPNYTVHIEGPAVTGGNEVIPLAIDTASLDNDSAVAFLITANEGTVNLGKISLYANGAAREFRFLVDNGGGTLIEGLVLEQDGTVNLPGYGAGVLNTDGSGLISATAGATGSFTAQTGEVVTVTNGIITSIV
jgi:hypothetical protein